MDSKCALVLVGLVCLIASINMAPLEDESLDATTVAFKNPYFGVDGDDAEAVAKKQKELGDQKAKELFGPDVNLDNIDFQDWRTLEDHPLVQKLTQHLNKLKENFKKLADLFPSRNSTTMRPSV